MQIKTIERRLPFGFLGDWGKCYKKYTAGIQTLIDSGEVEGEDYIRYQRNYYRDIGQDVQFKEASDFTGGTEENNKGLQRQANYLTVKTTDAWFNEVTAQYECIVENGDVIEVFGRKWTASNVTDVVVRRTPNMIKVFTIGLNSLV